MTTSGEPPSGARGVDEPDWIDQILERATKQVDANAVPSRPVAPRQSRPIVPETAHVSEAEARTRATQAPPRRSEEQPQWSEERPQRPTEQPQQRAEPSQPRSRASAAQADAPVVRRAPQPVDGLAEIRWVDSPEVSPASAPIVAAEPTLVPTAVGRSARTDDLALVGQTGDPDGWDKLSWQDLDDRQGDHSPIQEQTSFGRLLREWGPVLFAAVAIALFTRLVLVQAYHIPSASMVPTLEVSDRVVVNRLSYQFGEIERGQVVVFSKPPGSSGENDLIKRVIGLPGETIQFVDEQVYINGLRVDEPYLAEPDSTRPTLVIPGCAQVDPSEALCTIPEGHVFVMGDNRLGSSDSRVFGPIETDSIVGRAFMRVWPLNNLGEL